MTENSVTSPHHPTLVVITGPTAVGKTALCVEIAKHFNTEIVSADSRQFFKEMSIGTAKPTASEMQGIPHHFIDFISVERNYNVNDFEEDTINLLNRLFKNNRIIILTGGSGLYLDAICHGFDDLPSRNELIREELQDLYQKYGIEILQLKLEQLDPDYYTTIDKNNVSRLERAIETCVSSPIPFSQLRKGEGKKRPFNIIKIALQRDRTELFERINQRVDKMMEQGLLEEVEKLTNYRDLNSLKTVGYIELFEYLDDITTLDHAVEKIKVNTRRYAKKQMAWFARSDDYEWFHPNQKQEIINHITSEINKH